MLAGGYKYAICGHRSAGSPRPSGCDSGFAFFKFQLARFLGADRCVIGTYYFVPLSLHLPSRRGGPELSRLPLEQKKHYSMVVVDQ